MTESHSTPSFPVLDELTRRALQHLESLRSSPHSLKPFRKSWLALCRIAREQALPDALSDDLIDRFLSLHRVPSEASMRTPHDRHLRRAMHVLGEFSVHGTVCRRRARDAYPPPLPAFAEARFAAANTTITPTYTRRPRNRTEGGVIRLRHPSREQRKLKRSS